MKRGEWFRKMTHLGVQDSDDTSSNRGIILSNQIVIFLLPLLLFSIVLEYLIQDIALMMSFVVMVPFLLFIYYLNSTYHTRISRYLLSVGPNLIILLVILMVGDIKSGNYLGLPLAFIGLSFFAVVLFDWQNEKALIIYASIVNLIIVLTFDHWLDVFGKNQVSIDLIRDNYLLYKSTHVLLWMTISFCILFIKRLNHQFELRLQKQNVELKNKSNEIITQNEEIVSQNEELLVQHDQILNQKQYIEDQNIELKRKEEALSKSLQNIRDAQKELAKKEAESRSILNALKDHFIVIEYDLSGKIHFVNESLLRASGITKDQIITNSFGSKEKAEQWQNLNKGHSFNTEMEFKTNKGKYCINSTHAPIFDEFGNVDRILAIGFDVSLIKQQKEEIDRINVDLQSQLKVIESQKIEIEQSNNNLERKVFERTKQLEHQNKQLAEYAFINAHLLRAPVCTIMGLVNLLKYSDLSSEDIVIINKLLRSVKTLDEIVRKINIAIRERSHFDRNTLGNEDQGKENPGFATLSN